MTDISTVCTDLLSIVGNNRMPIKTKRILIKRFLNAITTFIDLKPNKIYNLKKKKINKILSLLPSIKYNVELKKLLTKELITDITNFENYPNIIFDEEEDDNNKGKEYEKTWDNCIKKIYLSKDTDKSNFEEAKKNDLPNKEILIGTVPLESEEDSEVESENSNESLNSDSDTEEESECEQVSDDTDESEIDSDEIDTEKLDNTINNLVEDLGDDAKAKLIIKLTKYKLEHEFNMEAEKNRNMERMEELSIKKLKINNKYKIKKLENRK